MKEQGITLVTLTITVIVLIILAGVTLSTLVGEEGIITKTLEAKQNMTNATAEEDSLIKNLLNEIKGTEGGNIDGGDPEQPVTEISFGEVIWENGKAKITIQSSKGQNIQYQINETSGEWIEIVSGGTIENLQHGDIIYASLTGEEGSSGITTKKIEDTIAPRVEVEVGEITARSIEVNVTATEEESGLKEVETYEYYIGEVIAGKSVNNSYIYNDLETEKEYNLIVKVQDKAGNIGENSIIAKTGTGAIITSPLKEGDYVWYNDAKGKQRKCIVLYGGENENYSRYGLQIITTDIVENIVLGSESTVSSDEDFYIGRMVYNNLISTLNTKAEEYRNKEDGIAIKARSVGSLPDNPESEGGYYSNTEYWFDDYNGTFKSEDVNYISDWNQMEKLGIQKIEGEYYYLASRIVTLEDKEISFGPRIVSLNGTIYDFYNFCRIYVLTNSYTSASQLDYGCRAVFYLNPSVKIVNGDGSIDNPYTLSL